MTHKGECYSHVGDGHSSTPSRPAESPLPDVSPTGRQISSGPIKLTKSHIFTSDNTSVFTSPTQVENESSLKVSVFNAFPIQASEVAPRFEQTQLGPRLGRPTSSCSTIIPPCGSASDTSEAALISVNISDVSVVPSSNAFETDSEIVTSADFSRVKGELVSSQAEDHLHSSADLQEPLQLTAFGLHEMHMVPFTPAPEQESIIHHQTSVPMTSKNTLNTTTSSSGIFLSTCPDRLSELSLGSAAKSLFSDASSQLRSPLTIWPYKNELDTFLPMDHEKETQNLLSSLPSQKPVDLSRLSTILESDHPKKPLYSKAKVGVNSITEYKQGSIQCCPEGTSSDTTTEHTFDVSVGRLILAFCESSLIGIGGDRVGTGISRSPEEAKQIDHLSTRLKELIGRPGVSLVSISHIEFDLLDRLTDQDTSHFARVLSKSLQPNRPTKAAVVPENTTPPRLDASVVLILHEALEAAHKTGKAVLEASAISQLARLIKLHLQTDTLEDLKTDTLHRLFNGAEAEGSILFEKQALLQLGNYLRRSALTKLSEYELVESTTCKHFQAAQMPQNKLLPEEVGYWVKILKHCYWPDFEDFEASQYGTSTTGNSSELESKLPTGEEKQKVPTQLKSSIIVCHGAKKPEFLACLNLCSTLSRSPHELIFQSRQEVVSFQRCLARLYAHVARKDHFAYEVYALETEFATWAKHSLLPGAPSGLKDRLRKTIDDVCTSLVVEAKLAAPDLALIETVLQSRQIRTDQVTEVSDALSLALVLALLRRPGILRPDYASLLVVLRHGLTVSPPSSPVTLSDGEYTCIKAVYECAIAFPKEADLASVDSEMSRLFATNGLMRIIKAENGLTTARLVENVSLSVLAICYMSRIEQCLDVKSSQLLQEFS
ncbi:unnamed protein product, partial [Protopolystoma xenopodis]